VRSRRAQFSGPQPRRAGGDAEATSGCSRVCAHRTLLWVAPLLAPFGSLVPQTRVRIRATGSASYGRSIPSYPAEWGGGGSLPDDRDLRDAWPEGVTLPRAIVYNLACTTLGMPAVTSDIAVLDRRAAVILERHVPGYREIIASGTALRPRAAGLVFGKAGGYDRDAPRRRLWVDAHARRSGGADAVVVPAPWP
jgi:hypothetical protein